MSRDERGFSLIEALVASLVMSLIVGGLYAAFDQSQTFYESYRDSAAMLQQARVGLDSVASELRMTGYDIGDLDEPLTEASDTAVQFVADIDDGDAAGPCDSSFEDAPDGGAERVRFSLDTNTGVLTRTIDCYNGSAWTDGVQQAAIVRDLDPSSVVFRFFDADGDQLPNSSGGTLSESERLDVVAVEILFDLIDTSETQLVGETNTNLFLSTRVRLHNVAQ